jgi:hypothetical protein
MLELQIVMGRGLMVWQRFLVPEVAGSNPAVPAISGLNWNLSPERAAFSLVARSASQMFSGGERE